MTPDRPCTLVTIPISHYCEKARWALDYAGVAFEERAHLQLLHRVAVRRAGGGSTAPVLVCGERVLADSVDIVSYANASAPSERKLYPEDPEATAEIRALEAEYDERLGPHTRRWAYDLLRDRRDFARYLTPGVPGWQRRLLPASFRIVVKGIDRVLDIRPETVAESAREVRAVFDAVAARLDDGRPYLAGERFTAADLTFSSLAGPLVLPAEYGFGLPRLDELSGEAAEVVQEFRGHRAGEHALEMFARHRRIPAGATVAA